MRALRRGPLAAVFGPLAVPGWLFAGRRRAPVGREPGESA